MTVYDIAQDASGFIWLGTGDGLNRYDGNRIEIYRHSPEVEHSLSDHYIHRLLGGVDGTLWVGTLGGGLNRYLPAQEQFLRYPIGGVGQEYEVSSLSQGRNGALWMGTMNHGLYRIPTRGEERDEVQAILPDHRVHDLQEDQHGNIWVATEQGLLKLTVADAGGYSITAVMSRYPRISVKALLLDPEQRLWIGTEEGLCLFDLSTEQCGKMIMPYAITSLTWANGGVWAGTARQGIHYYNLQQRRFHSFTHQKADLRGLPSSRIESLYTDATGILWVGTYNAGAAMVNPRQWQFHHQQLGKQGSEFIQAFANNRPDQDDGVYWVGTTGGLYRYRVASGVDAHWMHNPEDPNSLSDSDVRSIYQDEEGILWIGTWGGGLNRFDPVSGQFIHYMPDEDDPQTLSNDVIRLILEDHEGKLWLGTQHGLSHFDKVSGQVERYLHDADDSYSLPHDRIRALYEDRQHRIWVGTSGGLSLLDREEGTFTNWKKELKNPQALRGNDVRSILQDHQGRIWVGTDAGLHQFDPEKGVVVRHIGSFDEPNGEAYQLYEDPLGSKWFNLPVAFVKKRVEKGESNETLYRVLEDQQGTIWFSSNRGIGRLDPESGKLKRYTRGDGLQEDEFNFNAALLGDQGELLFGGVNGFNRFTPERLQRDESRVRSQLVQLYIEHQPVTLSPPLMQRDSLQLQYDQNHISIDFAVLHFANPTENRVRYRMEGVEREWRETTASDGRAVYAGLQPGNYRFLLQASNVDGGWEEEGQMLDITIYPPFWQTTAAYITYVLLLLLLLIFTVWLRTRLLAQRAAELKEQVVQKTATIKQQAEKLQESLDEKNRLFSRMAHELQSPTAIIDFPLQNLLKKEKAPPSLPEPIVKQLSLAQKSLHGLQRLIQQLNSLARCGSVEQGEKHVEEVTETAHHIVASYRSLMEERRLDLVVEIERGLKARLLPDALQQILSNLLSNALKYVPEGGRVELKVGETEEKNIEIVVTDDGPGIPESSRKEVLRPFVRLPGNHHQIKGSGIGLALVSELAQTHGGGVEILSAHGGKGCCVQVQLQKGG